MNARGRARSRKHVEELLQLRLHLLAGEIDMSNPSSYVLHWGGDNTVGLRCTGKDSLFLEYATGGRHVEQQVKIERIPCPVGGARPMFRCPRCERRCAVLLFGGRFACRRCFPVIYRSQSLDPFNRLWWQELKLARRMTGDPEAGHHEVTRKRRMHRTTHERLLARVRDLRERRDAVFIVAAVRWLRRLGAPRLETLLDSTTKKSEECAT